MSELQAEQERQKREQQEALESLGDRYQKQIDSLQAHLQRVVNESHGKDEQINRVSDPGVTCPIGDAVV